MILGKERAVRNVTSQNSPPRGLNSFNEGRIRGEINIDQLQCHLWLDAKPGRVVNNRRRGPYTQSLTQLWLIMLAQKETQGISSHEGQVIYKDNPENVSLLSDIKCRG